MYAFSDDEEDDEITPAQGYQRQAQASSSSSATAMVLDSPRRPRRNRDTSAHIAGLASPSAASASSSMMASSPPPRPSSPSARLAARRTQPGAARPSGSARGISPTPSTSSLATSSGPSALKTTPMPAIEKLQTIWVQERCSPEILPWSLQSSRWRPDEIVDVVCDQIEQQVSILNLLSADESTSEEEHLRLSMVQLDVERCKWLLRAFLRTRIQKIEQHSARYQYLSSSDLEVLLSPLEAAYLRKYSSLRTSHFQSTVLDYLPENLRGLDDGYDEMDINGPAKGSMIEEPDLMKPVFVRCKEDCGGVTLADGEKATLSSGSIHILSYAVVRSLIRQGRVELL